MAVLCGFPRYRALAAGMSPPTELFLTPLRTFHCKDKSPSKEPAMDGNIIGLVAVMMSLGIPLAALYTYYSVRKLRTEERLAAIARGVSVPMQPDLSEAGRSRRSGILLTAGAIGYIVTFALIARGEPDAWAAAAFGAIPLALGLGFFLDAALIRHDQHA